MSDRIINVLDEQTIDKIAAGEVVERPMSVVKELTENAIDSGADLVTIEIKDGGTSYIRVTDNGCGIDKEQIPTAFLRHATSKIKTIEDLLSVNSLGFRGEALSSIAAVSKVELLTKTRDSISGSRYCIEGSREMSLDDVGIPDGTTFIVRHLFYNVPARRKFLKSSNTEGSYISDYVEKVMLSHPEVSFKLIVNGKTKLQSSGNGNVKDVIYALYGKEFTRQIIPIKVTDGDVSIEGFVGKPELARGNRNYEIYYVNNRYIQSNLVKKALDEAYKPYLMLHKYPAVVLYFDISPDMIDVNVHPTKMEVRFLEAPNLYRLLVDSISNALRSSELIVDVKAHEEIKSFTNTVNDVRPEPFEKKHLEQKKTFDNMSDKITGNLLDNMSEVNRDNVSDKMTGNLLDNMSEVNRENVSDNTAHITSDNSVDDLSGELSDTIPDNMSNKKDVLPTVVSSESIQEVYVKKSDAYIVNNKDSINSNNEANKSKEVQLSLFENGFLTKEAVKKHRIIGQLFDTYWLVEYEKKLYIIDQHAAHEKVKYERLMKQYESGKVNSQMLNPPIVVTLSKLEEEYLLQFMKDFNEVGFEIEEFGGNEYSIRAIPTNLFGLSADEYFHDLLDQLMEDKSGKTLSSVADRIATMACKSAVKGNNSLSFQEAKTLIDELLTLENPYNCPHGRPTIISFTKTEVEKMFKRIVT